MDCSAWVQSERNAGFTTRFDVWIDELSCGTVSLGNAGWTRVGGQVRVGGNSHVVTVAVTSEGADASGMGVGIDDVRVVPVPGC